MKIVLATHNAHKLAELKQILEPLLPQADFTAPTGEAPAETGVSFAENALLKARAVANSTGQIALADDSGIAVDVLGGAPGIFSARWAGACATDKDNLELLLAQLADIAPEHRQAAFVCAAAAVIPQPGEQTLEVVVTARWEGALLTAPSGGNGFGYDPIFRPQGFSVSAAKLDPLQKNQLSHRYQAFSELGVKLAKLL